MKAISIPAHESAFQSNGIDSNGKKFILTEGTFTIKGTAKTLKIIDCPRQNNIKNYYYEEETAKRKIVLHFTMGYLKGDIATLTNGHVSVPFVIGRNGNIYNLFASKYWSYHLGPSAVGGNTGMSKESIGIEISNIGPLIKKGNNLVTTYSSTDIYCTLDDTDYYVKLNSKYRGFEYYATFTDAQYEAIIKLLKFLCAKYSLPKKFIPEPQRHETLTAAEFSTFTGIASHVNCRKDKVDIGPAFDWERIVSGV